MSRIDEAINVEVPANVCYDRWTRFEYLPLFMDGVEQVTQLDDSTFRWEAEIGGVRREWTAQITQMIPPQRIAWTTTGGDSEHQGAVFFTVLDEARCEVRVRMQMNPHGFAEQAADTLGVIRRRVQQDLERFKESMEQQPARS